MTQTFYIWPIKKTDSEHNFVCSNYCNKLHAKAGTEHLATTCFLVASLAYMLLRAPWARTFKCLWGPGIDSKEWIPPAYVAGGPVR